MRREWTVGKEVITSSALVCQRYNETLSSDKLFNCPVGQRAERGFLNGTVVVVERRPQSTTDPHSAPLHESFDEIKDVEDGARLTHWSSETRLEQQWTCVLAKGTEECAFDSVIRQRRHTSVFRRKKNKLLDNRKQ